MKLRIVSDLHFEFQSDEGDACAKRVTAGEWDVFVLAGDLSNYRLLRQSLEKILNAAKGKPIVFVPGKPRVLRVRVATQDVRPDSRDAE